MKKNLITVNLFVLIFFIGITSCDNSLDDVKDLDISLEAPSGDIIAQSVEELKGIISPIIDETHKGAVDFEISSIYYFDSPKGIVAIIDYITAKGEESNLALCRNFPNKINIDPNVKKRYLSQHKGGDVTITCNGDECCTVVGKENENGSIDFYCGCNGCSMTIEIDGPG